MTGECLGARTQTGEYAWISYAQVANRKDYIGSGIIHLIGHTEQELVGICTRTRPEFVLTMLACSHYSMVLVPLYHSFGGETLAQIIRQVNMQVVFCETPDVAAEIMKRSDWYPSLKHVIVIEGERSHLKQFRDNKLFVHTLIEVEMLGQLNPQAPKKPNPEDLFCLCYTSGTTGVPKGVMVSHKNVMSCIAALDNVIGDCMPDNEALMMCYLPCAHIYEIVNEIFCLFHGGKLGYFSGDTDKLLEDIQELKPDVLPLVPKIMNLIYSGAEKKIASVRFLNYFYRKILQKKEKQLKKGIVSKYTFWDNIILTKIQEVLGGHLQMIFTSSAPVSKEVMEFFRCAMGCLVFEAYGLSETCASTMTLPSEHGSGFVGAPLPCNHVKLIDVPELSYSAENDEGEICIRGTNVFSGYYKNPEQTKEVLDQEGWYHTGDIGKWLPNGTLAVIDRKKNIFKLSQGEYVLPDKIESIYIQSPIVSQILVDGNTDQDFIVGIVVPDEKPFMQWAEKKGFGSDFENMCQNEEVKNAVLKDLVQLGKERELKSLHQVGNIFLTGEPFSIENGLMTPTMKLRRYDCRKKYEKVLKNLYKEGNLQKSLDL